MLYIPFSLRWTDLSSDLKLRYTPLHVGVDALDRRIGGVSGDDEEDFARYILQDICPMCDELPMIGETSLMRCYTAVSTRETMHV